MTLRRSLGSCCALGLALFAAAAPEARAGHLVINGVTVMTEVFASGAPSR
jgi:hypothetical protein